MLDLVILSDHRLFRDGLACLLSGRPETRIMGLYTGAEEARALAGRNAPDAVLLDAGLPDIAAEAERARLAWPSASLIALALPDQIAAVLECAEAGVSGFVTRDASVEGVIEAISAARAGELLCSPKIAAGLFTKMSGRSMDSGVPLGRLTPRETEVLRRIERGQSNKQIAMELRIGLSTVKNHVHNVLEKLGVERRGEAAALYRGGRGEAGRRLRRAGSSGANGYARAPGIETPQ